MLNALCWVTQRSAQSDFLALQNRISIFSIFLVIPLPMESTKSLVRFSSSSTYILFVMDTWPDKFGHDAKQPVVVFQMLA